MNTRLSRVFSHLQCGNVFPKRSNKKAHIELLGRLGFCFIQLQLYLHIIFSQTVVYFTLLRSQTIISDISFSPLDKQELKLHFLIPLERPKDSSYATLIALKIFVQTFPYTSISLSLIQLMRFESYQ